MLVQEIVKSYGISDFPRTTSTQMAWFQDNATWISCIQGQMPSFQVGDIVYWQRSDGGFHTGVITQISPIIKSVNASWNKGKSNCIVSVEVNRKTGENVGWHQPIVGIGRLNN